MRSCAAGQHLTLSRCERVFGLLATNGANYLRVGACSEFHHEFITGPGADVQESMASGSALRLVVPAFSRDIACQVGWVL